MKVFSFCLYGSNPKYTMGMLENIKIINEHFPEWFTYIYYDDVPTDILEKITSFQNIKLCKSCYTGAKTMLDRFTPIDDPNAEIMLVRDADSRIHPRDRWAINAFIKSPKKFHIIRDHIWHGTLILGGLWGIKQGLLPFKLATSMQEFEKDKENKWQIDQIYLREYIYPRIKHDVLLHGSLKMLKEEIMVPFPCPVTDDDFCGQAIDYQNGVPVKLFDLKGFVKK